MEFGVNGHFFLVIGLCGVQTTRMATEIVFHKGHRHVTDHQKGLCACYFLSASVLWILNQKWSLFTSAILSLSITLSAVFHSLFLLLHAMLIWLDCVVVSSGSPVVSLPDYILLHKLPQYIYSLQLCLMDFWATSPFCLFSVCLETFLVICFSDI